MPPLWKTFFIALGCIIPVFLYALDRKVKTIVRVG